MKSILKAYLPEVAVSSLRRLKQEGIGIGRLFIRPPMPVNKDGKVFLNLGCGNTSHPAFINVDALAAWHIHYRRPVQDLSCFSNNYADLIYVSHCLEHFSHHSVNDVLAEWFRVVKPGGILRIGVPDFNKLLEIYSESGRDIEAIQHFLMGGQTYKLNYHYTAFTHTSLQNRLLSVGFSKVREWQWGADELTSLPDFTGFSVNIGDKRIPISLNLEAVK